MSTGSSQFSFDTGRMWRYGPVAYIRLTHYKSFEIVAGTIGPIILWSEGPPLQQTDIIILYGWPFPPPKFGNSKRTVVVVLFS